MTEYKKVLPVIEPGNKPLWDAAKKHELRMQKCLDCGKVRYPPTPICIYCWSGRYEWALMSGRGVLNSWVIFHQTWHPAWTDEVPYHVAEVELKEGPRLRTNIVGIKNEELRYKMPVEVYFDDVTPEVTLTKFKPVGKNI